jgi:hypothetical protein
MKCDVSTPCFEVVRVMTHRSTILKQQRPRNPRPKTAKPTTGFAERLDREGTIRKQADALGTLSRAPFRQVLRLLGVPQATFDKVQEARGAYNRLISELERTAVILGPLGWIAHGLAHTEAYSAAATLAEQGRTEEAEELLVRTYNDDNFAFIRFYQRVMSLYQENDHWNKIGLERLRVLNEAYDLHREGRYAGAIALVLTQIDGIFMDKTGKPARSFFEFRKAELVDDETLVGHPLGLLQLSRLLGEEQRTTFIGNKVNRHGVVHGRLLGFDNLRNSTKMWAALLCVIEAVGPGSRWHRPSTLT